MEEFIEKRIEENMELFSKEEFKTIVNNINIANKIYILATLDTYKTIKDA